MCHACLLARFLVQGHPHFVGDLGDETDVGLLHPETSFHSSQLTFQFYYASHKLMFYTTISVVGNKADDDRAEALQEEGPQKRSFMRWQAVGI